MPLVKFKIDKAEDIEIESIRFANTHIDPSNEKLLKISSTSIESKKEIDVPTSNPILLTTIRGNGSMEGLIWSFDITINGTKITDDPEEIPIDQNGQGDLQKGYPY